LKEWEQVGLIAPSDAYSFQDMVHLRKLRDLRAMRLSSASIRDSVAAMRAVSGMANPLLEAMAIGLRGRLAFRHSGAVVEPVRGQFLFDFEQAPALLPVGGGPARAHQAREQQTQSLFFDAIQHEEAGEHRQAAALYERILALDGSHAPAAINLGTILYNQRQYGQAEHLYRRATESDPGYALAFFDLGNVLDELGRIPESIAAYRKAIALAPNYADAHYNLALAFERSGQRRLALPHWQTYIRLDPVGPWASHARSQVRKILDREGLSLVHSTSARSRLRTEGRPETRLELVEPV
jgi:tetratricopeptide (TPR) repeat protein